MMPSLFLSQMGGLRLKIAKIYRLEGTEMEVRTRLLSSSWKRSSNSCFAKVWFEIIEMFWTLR